MTTKPEKGPSVSQLIKDYKEKHPDAKASKIAEAVSSKIGRTIKANYIYNILNKSKSKPAEPKTRVISFDNPEFKKQGRKSVEGTKNATVGIQALLIEDETKSNADIATIISGKVGRTVTPQYVSNIRSKMLKAAGAKPKGKPGRKPQSHGSILQGPIGFDPETVRMVVAGYEFQALCGGTNRAVQILSYIERTQTTKIEL